VRVGNTGDRNTPSARIALASASSGLVMRGGQVQQPRRWRRGRGRRFPALPTARPACPKPARIVVCPAASATALTASKRACPPRAASGSAGIRNRCCAAGPPGAASSHASLRASDRSQRLGQGRIGGRGLAAGHDAAIA
jgi:hypothetical protein